MSVPTTMPKQPTTKSVPQPRVAMRAGARMPSASAMTSSARNSVSVASGLAPIIVAPHARCAPARPITTSDASMHSALGRENPSAPRACSLNALDRPAQDFVLDADAPVLRLGLLDRGLLGRAQAAAELRHLLGGRVVGVRADDDVIGEL